MFVAIGQVSSGPEPDENLQKARAQIAEASDRGALGIVFPEYLMWWNSDDRGPAATAEVAEPLDGNFVTSLQSAAAEFGMWIVGGMLESHSLSDPRPFNTTVVIDDRGTLVSSYRKSHLYNAFSYRESETIAPGDWLFEPIVTPFGQTGLFVCYELRFPEVARHEALKGSTVLLVPSAWVMGPLKLMHWRTLITARAIENGCYVVAAAQCGNGYAGHSLIIDPMGEAVVEAGDDEVVLTADIYQERVEQVRRIVPSLTDRRAELYYREAQPWRSSPDVIGSLSS
jgi:predicted amidohydrolase